MGLLDSFNPNFASSPQFQQGCLRWRSPLATRARLLAIQGVADAAATGREQFQQARLAWKSKRWQAQLDSRTSCKTPSRTVGGSQTAPSQQDGGGGHGKRKWLKVAAGSNGGMLGSEGLVAQLQSFTPDQVLGLKMMGIDAMGGRAGNETGANMRFPTRRLCLRPSRTLVPAGSCLPLTDHVMNGVATAMPGYAQAMVCLSFTDAGWKRLYVAVSARWPSSNQCRWTPQEVQPPTGEKIVRPSLRFTDKGSSPMAEPQGHPTPNGGTLAQPKLTSPH